MYTKLRSFIAFFLTLALSTLPALAETAQAEPISLYKQIGNEVITTSDLAESTPKKTEEQLPWYKKVLTLNSPELKRFMYPELTIKSLNPGEQRVLLYNSLQDNKSTTDVLQPSAWFDLEFFKHSNFLKTISHVRTAEGQAVLSKMIALPAKTKAECSFNQAIVKDLVEKPRLLQALDEELKKIAAAESYYFALLKDDPETVTKHVELINPYPGLKSSTSTSAQETGAVIAQSINGFMVALVDAAWIAGIAGAIYAHHKGLLSPFMQGAKQGLEAKGISSGVVAGYSFFGLTFFALLTPGMNLQVKNGIFSVPKHLQTRLYYAAQVTNAYKRLYQLVSANPLLRKGVVGIDNMNTLLLDTNSQPKDLKKVLNNLSTNTFAGNHSIFTVTGRILATSLLFTQKDVRDQLISLAEPIGSIDAYVSMAKLYKESQNTATPYCFVEFVDQTTPYLLIENVWNPLVGKGKAIPNSVEFGGKNARNMILTGQNTAGKSTVLKAITYSIVLAQSFGIAPASRMVLTPFSVINTYVNVTDDVANGRSLFANEVFRAQGLIDRVQGLKPNEFSFTIIDEMFRGTGPEHAEVLSYKYAKKLAEFDNAIVIESTHYPKLIKLEEETNGIYKNYRIDIIKKEDGSLFRPYKLEKGYTLTNIAEDILKEAGLILE